MLEYSEKFLEDVFVKARELQLKKEEGKISLGKPFSNIFVSFEKPNDVFLEINENIPEDIQVNIIYLGEE